VSGGCKIDAWGSLGALRWDSPEAASGEILAVLLQELREAY
jgi:hypothetical protein